MYILLTLAAFSLLTGTAHAYLSPEDVFTDLKVSDGAEVTEDAEPVPPSSPTPEKTAPEATPEPTPAPPVQAPPAFFRSGEPIKQGTIPDVDTSAADSPFDEEPSVFEEKPEILIPTLPSPETFEEEENAEEDLVEDTSTVEEEGQEEERKAAPRKKQSVMMALLGRMKYLAIAVVLAAGAIGFFLKRKPKTATGPSVPKKEIPAPEKPQQVEESSERIQHALEAMGEHDAVDEEKPQ